MGTVTVVEEDRQSNYYLALLKYFLAEGLAVEQETFLASPDPKFLERIPKNLTEEHQSEKAKENNDTEDKNKVIMFHEQIEVN